MKMVERFRAKQIKKSLNQKKGKPMASESEISMSLRSTNDKSQIQNFRKKNNAQNKNQKIKES